VAAGHSGQFTPMRLPVNTVIHTTLVVCITVLELECKRHWIVLYTVHFTAFRLGGGRFYSDTVYTVYCIYDQPSIKLFFISHTVTVLL